MASIRVAMAVLCVALVATYMAGSEARPEFPGRSLLAPSFTCSAAKALSGQCDSLCKCVGNDPSYKGRQISECTGPCQSCVSATSSCPSDDSLPGACKSYADNPAVKKCIGARAWRELQPCC